MPAFSQAYSVPEAHALPTAAVADRLAVDPPSGLESTEAARRAARIGPNQLEPPKRTSVWRLVVEAATEPFVLLLLAAGAGAVLLGEARDGLLVLVGLIPIVGADVITEYRGERALEALRDASAPMARVRRNGDGFAGHRRRARAWRRGPAVGRRRRSGRPALWSASTACSSTAASSPASRCRSRDARSPMPGTAIWPTGDRSPMRGTSVVGGRGEGIVVATGTRDRVRPDRGRADRSRSAAARRCRPSSTASSASSCGWRSGLIAIVMSLGFIRGQDAGRDDPRRHLGRDRRDPRGAADPPRGRPRAGCLPAPQAGRARAPAQRRGVARRRRPDHHRQDRDADPQPARRGLGSDTGRPGRGRRRATRPSCTTRSAPKRTPGRSVAARRQARSPAR